MRRCLRAITDRIAHQAASLGRKIYQSKDEQRVVKWFCDQGDKTLRLNYNLDENSVVFDLGGYEGQWTSDIFSKYCCYIHVFEPVPQLAAAIEKRFEQNPKITVYQFGLADKSYKTGISLELDRSSIINKCEKATEVNLVKATDFLQNQGIKKIDLMKINIEGAEYDLLEHLIDTGYIRNINNIQVQFHDFVPGAECRMNKIQEKLSTTHFLSYQYKFVWENWVVKSS